MQVTIRRNLAHVIFLAWLGQVLLATLPDKCSPGDDDKESGREVVGDDVEGDLPGEHHLEAGHRVVHAQRHVVRVLQFTTSRIY